MSGQIYLLHFDAPLGAATLHYIGYAKKDLQNRLAQHASGAGARITQVLFEKGIGFRCVRIWRGGRKEERTLKNQRNHKRFCPICSVKPRKGFDRVSRQAREKLTKDEINFA